MINFFKKNKQAWPLLYLPFIYLPWFLFLENHITTEYTIIHCPIDDIIPFCEYFIIPYLLWFLYVPAVFLCLYYTNTKDFQQLCAFMFIGCSICLLIYTVFPNGQELRLTEDMLASRNNIFTVIISKLYGIDTSTNVFPSIHVYNSICCHIALSKSTYGKKRPFIKTASLILTILICISTMVLKQHSILDAAGAIVLASIMYPVVYKLFFREEHVLIEAK
ncbi:MAG: phosphatase PAP2 family protein [Eubacterium sp.]